jgi:hypothetical protein
MTSAQPAEARLESAGQGRPWRRGYCRAHWSSPPRHEEKENGRQQQCRGVQLLKSQGPPASVGRRRGQTSCGRGLRLSSPWPSASHPLLAPTAQRLQCNAMQCDAMRSAWLDTCRPPFTGYRDRGHSRRTVCAEYRSLCPCLSSADGCTRCEVRCSMGKARPGGCNGFPDYTLPNTYPGRAFSHSVQPATLRTS